jgi:hypothetical protein
MTQAAKTQETGFEKQIEDVLAEKKGQIEKSLAEIIEQEKEKAKQKLSEIEQEFQKGKDSLRRHKEMLDEVAAAAADVRDRIRKHVDQARHCRIMIQRMADQIGEECRQAGELKQEVLGLYGKAAEESRRLEKELESRYGMTVPFPEVPGAGDINADLEQEIEGLNEFVERLGGGGEKNVGPREAATETGGEAPQEKCVLEGFHPPQGDSLGGPVQEEKPVEQTAPAEEAAKTESGETEDEEVSRILEARKMTEAFPGGGELRYYQSNSTIVLDGESLLDQMIRFIEEARILHSQLEGTKSATEQFFVKRDILNHQEYLRKIILRAIKLCEKDKCDLPLLTSDIMSMQTLRDILERLSMGNWSDPYDMRMFGEEIFLLKASLFARTAAQLSYRKSIIEQHNQG